LSVDSFRGFKGKANTCKLGVAIRSGAARGRSLQI
jgi:hypothetical protein